MNNLYESIFLRKSTRKYSLENLDHQTIREIKKYLLNVETLFDTNLQTYLVSKTDIYSMLDGYIGSIGKIEAPYYLILSNEDSKEGYLDVGYGGEQIVLELTKRQLATCWIGANFSGLEIKKHFNINQSIISLISVGKASDYSPFRDKESIKRKDVSDILIKDLIDDNYLPIVEAIRVAPSAVNNQPWRVLVEKDSISLYMAKANLIKRFMLKNLNYVDMGIATKHLKIALDNFGYTYSWGKNTQKDIKDLEYIITAKIKGVKENE
ncbi:MAG: nitroreductase family protein [Clostridia bacterium]